ncbi:MAG TPA: helix-turn-helix domain-containing protein [Candidatus Limnocylindrales bacterium]|nr:helix-turn-helix domain-containing protein [Candidatus Limnocylindrales bacterium]
MTESRELRLTEVGTLRAMAHPLRMRILGSLRIDGPATSAMLARRLNTDSGQTSHHLRQLARFGFVVEAPDLGKGSRGRERWWRAGHESTSWDDLSALGPEGAEAVHAFENVAHRVWAQMLSQYRMQAGRQEWSPAWVQAAASGDFPIRTTPEGLAALLAELREVIARHDLGEQAGPDAETVIVLLHGFPRRVTP